MPIPWKAEEYLLKVADAAVIPTDLVPWVAERVFRRDFNKPGFACLTLTSFVDSFRLRQLMVSLKQSLSQLFHASFGSQLKLLPGQI